MHFLKLYGEMMNLTAFIFLIFALQGLCLYIGSRSSKSMKTEDDYFLAGKNIRFFPLMMTFLATQVGGGLVLGSSEEAFQFGWSVLFYPLGAALGLILLGLGVGRRLAQFQVTTVAQIFEVVYGSSVLKKIASILSIITFFIIFIAQVVGSNKFMLCLGVDNQLWFFGFWAIVIAYTALGGLKAVVDTDIIQAAFFVAVFFASFIYVGFYSELPLRDILSNSLNSDQYVLDSSKMYGWLLMPLLFMVIEQDMAQRCFAGNSPKTVSKATLWAGIWTMIVCIIPVFFGVIAKGMGLSIPKGASVLMSVIIQTTDPLFAALVGCAIIAAITSTADSLVNAIGSNLSQDFDFKFLKDKNLRLTKLTSAFIAIAGIFCSFFFNNVVDLLILSYELSVYCLFVPVFIAIFKKKGNSLSAKLAVAFGAAAFFAFKLFPIGLPKEVITLAISFSGFYLGELYVSKFRILISESQKT